MNFILDTNAYSDFMRGDGAIAGHLGRAELVYLPVIVIGELKRGFYGGNKVSPNLSAFKQFLAKPRVQTLDVNAETAEHFGRLAAYLKKQGTPIPVNDVWIAALCVQYEVPLLTGDTDFDYLPQISLLV